MSDRFPKTVVRCKSLDAKLARETFSHEIYYCPFCYDKEVEYGVTDPKPDKFGKLYIEKGQDRGFCHRCSTVVYTKWSVETSFTQLTNILSNSLCDEITPDSLPEIKLDGLPLAADNEQALQYLKSRNRAFTEKSVRRLNLKWYEAWQPMYDDSLKEWIRVLKKGILIPLYHNGIIKSYQIRYITNDKKLRFHTMDGIKLVGSITNIQPGSEISICEGWFDAVALLCMKFPNPVCLLGKSPSNFQVHQLRELVPIRINYCLDEVGLSVSLMKQLRKQIKSVVHQKFWDFKDKDPEEYYRDNPDFKYQSWTK